MNGAESLVRTLVGGGVNVCFANQGISEMHLVAALDRIEGMRSVIGLFEEVVTEGRRRLCSYDRESVCDPVASRPRYGQPARQSTMPTSARADGQHRRRPCDLPRRYDAPLTTHIETIAKPFSRRVKTSLGIISSR
jgi:acetolactate synthase I/II/III large subunit